MTESLDSVLTGSTPAAVVEQATVTNEPETEAPKVETEVAPTATEEPQDDPQSVPVKAVQDERRKRQAAEAANKEMAAELAELRKPKTEEPQRPDATEDPEGAYSHLEGSFQSALLKERINTSREMMMELKADYEEKENVFIQLAKENPSLVNQMNKSGNPAKFAYKTAENHLAIQKLTDPKTVEQMKADYEKKWNAEFEAKNPNAKRNASALAVPDLNNATSAASGHATPQAEALDDVVGRGVDKKRK